eukprot:Em0002g418a
MIELESTLFDGAAAEQPHTVRVVSVRLGHLYGRLSHSLIRANAHAILTQKVDDLYVLWPAAGIAAARKSCRSD